MFVAFIGFTKCFGIFQLSRVRACNLCHFFFVPSDNVEQRYLQQHLNIQLVVLRKGRHKTCHLSPVSFGYKEF